MKWICPRNTHGISYLMRKSQWKTRGCSQNNLKNNLSRIPNESVILYTIGTEKELFEPNVATSPSLGLRIVQEKAFDPLPNNTAFWRNKNIIAVENIVRKGEIACNEQFILFSQGLSPYMALSFNFKFTLKCLQFVWFWTSLKICR